MFSKRSRYRATPDVAVLDAKGRVLPSKALRLLPDVTGTFRHTVAAGDRLDQLAFRYYSQSVQWWRICDAGPQVLSPLDLLGQGPLVTARFPVAVAGDPPWAALRTALAAQPAVADALFQEDVDGDRVTRAVLVTYNPRGVTSETLAQAIVDAGLQVTGPPAAAGQVGQEIVIPPPAVG